MLDIHAMPGHLIRRIHQAHGAIFAEECGALDLTSLQFAALSAIAAHPGVDATRLSSLIAFDRSTLGGVLERLEAKGWIVRDAAEGDRRVKLLRATPAGHALLRRAAPAVRRVQDRLLEPLSAADRRTALRLLAELAALHNDVTSAPLRAVG
ncbi:MarR family winged helix-turn-helix transcriptional regulator [Roseomonas sp. CCTCC AB2023176]|uniref:MarR family winged helix-turn-helix transcriptional regulator n=1 Tax=Roseomonas sp. CCTCC AB2023176 TaxID=3342640 RepID=UPI0035DEABB8